jgi:ABC-type dipeptide/oligopeptide/nickel transport system permease subunit
MAGAARTLAAAGALAVRRPVAPPARAADGMPLRPADGFWGGSFRRLVRNRVAMAALGGLMVLGALAFAAPFVERGLGVSRDTIDLLGNYQRPAAAHWFGTDEYGRDYLIRLLYGGQVSIVMGLGVMVVVFAIAVPFGLAAAYYGGPVDDLFLWIAQILTAVPTLFVLIVVAAWVPPSPLSLALIIGAFSWTGEARQTRGLALQVKRMDYVTAARALGASHVRIMTRHILPNIVSLVIVLAGFQVVGAVLLESALSYLGFGVRPPLPSWGNMLTNSLNYAFKAPHLVVFPGVAIGLLVLCVYTLADGLRDAFDPYLRGSSRSVSPARP